MAIRCYSCDVPLRPENLSPVTDDACRMCVPETPIRPCRVCQVPARGDICPRCFVKLYPEAAERHLDTRHARATARTARGYEQARAADERSRPPKCDR